MEDLFEETNNMKGRLPSKNEVINYLRNLSKNVEEGNYDSIKSYSTLKDIEKALNDSLDIVKEQAKEKVAQDPITFLDGWEFKIKSGGPQWDFTHIKKWVDLKDKIKLIEQEAKQNFHKMGKIDFGVDENGNSFNKQTGEIIKNAPKIMPKVKFKTDSIERKKIKNV